MQPMIGDTNEHIDTDAPANEYEIMLRTLEMVLSLFRRSFDCGLAVLPRPNRNCLLSLSGGRLHKT